MKILRTLFGPVPATSSASPAPRTPFVDGCVDSIPVCLTFLFLFFSIGAISRTAGFSPLQAMVMTAAVHASPLQALIAQHADTLTLLPLVMSTILVNFRFLIMASVLTEQFRSVPLGKVILSAQLLSISTFTLSNAKKGKIPNLFEYFLGCGVSTLSVATLATLLGFTVSAHQGPFVNALVAIILPVHFAALTGLSWPKIRPAIVTGAGFIATPIVGAWLGDYQVFVMPFVFGGFFLALDKFSEAKKS
ncbi:AzlC family ABC transporter permease [Paraherbaspirillum soli]|uniref:AzlC family ABC transporter permease n=1 Tax=Paraherbaspirillum soli TaxID=631222 RepID=A0ABW0M6F2_9BURK